MYWRVCTPAPCFPVFFMIFFPVCSVFSRPLQENFHRSFQNSILGQRKIITGRGQVLLTRRGQVLLCSVLCYCFRGCCYVLLLGISLRTRPFHLFGGLCRVESVFCVLFCAVFLFCTWYLYNIYILYILVYTWYIFNITWYDITCVGLIIICR